MVDPDNGEDPPCPRDANHRVVADSRSVIHVLQATGIVEHLVDLVAPDPPLGMVPLEVPDIRCDPHDRALIQLHVKYIRTALARVYAKSGLKRPAADQF
jgi:hypothetical protein